MRRREALKVIGAGVALPVLGQITAGELAALGVRIRSGALPKPRVGQLTYLNAHQNATVTAVADLIIPRTDTPGAADVGVNEFIDLIVGNWYRDRDRGDFMVGLGRIDERARERGGRDFVELGRDDQVALLTELEAESFALKDTQDAQAEATREPGPYPYPRADQPDSRFSGPPASGTAGGGAWDEHIFQRLKYLTLYGYYTSQGGMVEELHFRVVPGEFWGCAPNERVHGHPPLGTEGPPPAGEATQPDSGRVGRGSGGGHEPFRGPHAAAAAARRGGHPHA